MAQSSSQAQSIRLGPQGRVVIPVALRKLLDLRPGDAVVVWVEGDRLVLRPRRTVEEELWGFFAGVEGSLAEDLIRERRAEARHDDAQDSR